MLAIENFPAGQAEQVVWPYSARPSCPNVPLTHIGRQDDSDIALLPFVLLPAMQNRHPELEFNDEYVPCGHSWHDDQFIKENNPGPQSKQTEAFEAP